MQLNLVIQLFRIIFRRYLKRSFCLIIVILFVCCQKEAAYSDENTILDVSIPNINSTVSISEDKVVLNVDKSVDISNLTLLFEISRHATISPKSGLAHDFANPIVFRVVSESGLSKPYTVSVVKESYGAEKAITSCYLANIQHSALVSENSISIRVPKYTDITSLSPFFELSEFASISPKSGSAQSFIRPVEYTVTAEDGTEKKYTVTVIPAELSDQNDITSFTFSTKDYKQTSTEDGFHFEFYKHVNLAAIAPIIEISEFAAISPKSGETVNLTVPVVYTVTAENGATNQITVSGSQSLSNETELKDFKFRGIKQEFYQTGNNITIYVPYETDITHLQADITMSDFATITPSTESYLDFTQPQAFTVTSSDGAYSTWVVEVKKSKWRCLISTDALIFSQIN